MSSSSVQMQKLHTGQGTVETDQDVHDVGHDAGTAGDVGAAVEDHQTLHPTVSYLVRCYVSGISSSQRAILYLLLITYISYSYPDMNSSSYLADAKNPLNQYFVKYAWGWTFSAVFLFMVLTNYITTGTWVSERTFKSGCRLAVGTAVWYVFVRVIFLFWEEATGVCEVSEFVTKKTCYKAGHFWRGFDVSGHCFLLSWNNLFMVEELQGFFELRKTPKVKENGRGDNAVKQNPSNQKPQDYNPQSSSLAPYLEYFSCGLAVLMVLGEVMMLCTSLYFHTWLEKVLGTLCGLLSWFVMYRRVYKGTWHPGHVEEKQD